MNRDETIVDNGEIIHHDQLPLLSQCFQIMSTAESVYMLDRVKQLIALNL